MTRRTLEKLSIRTGVVREPDRGYVLACDASKAEQTPHAKIVQLHGTTLTFGDVNFNAHTACIISDPEPALLFASATGNYGISAAAGTTGNIHEECTPPHQRTRYGGIRALSTIAGKAYAVGYDGIVLRLDALHRWVPIGEELPEHFDIEAIDGFAHDDIYSAGRKGELWHFDGSTWTSAEIATQVDFNALCCVRDEIVYVAGDRGTLVCGRGDEWYFIEHGATEDTFWDLECFRNELYLSTMTDVYRLEGNELKLVDFNDDVHSCHRLSSSRDELWSIGHQDVMAFDGRKWRRIR